MPFHRILVPTDFSQGATDSLHVAAALGHQFRSELTILHVLEEVFTSFGTLYGIAVDPETVQPRLTELARKRLHSLIDDATYLQGLPVAPQLRGGSVPDEVAAAAREGQSDLIVISTHGRSGLTHLLLGSVTEKVIRNAPCPVLSLREPPRWSQGKIHPGHGQDHSRQAHPEPAPSIAVQKILVPTDLSDGSLAPLALARQLAQQFQARLDLVHVVMDVASFPVDAWEYVPGVTQDIIYGQTDDYARKRLDEIRAQRLGGIAGENLVRRGVPYLAILQLAADEQYDWIVMATHGRKGLQHAVLGSIAERVVRKSPCPVLTVRG